MNEQEKSLIENALLQENPTFKMRANEVVRASWIMDLRKDFFPSWIDNLSKKNLIGASRAWIHFLAQGLPLDYKISEKCIDAIAASYLEWINIVKAFPVNEDGLKLMHRLMSKIPDQAAANKFFLICYEWYTKVYYRKITEQHSLSPEKIYSAYERYLYVHKIINSCEDLINIVISALLTGEQLSLLPVQHCLTRIIPKIKESQKIDLIENIMIRGLNEGIPYHLLIDMYPLSDKKKAEISYLNLKEHESFYNQSEDERNAFLASFPNITKLAFKIKVSMSLPFYYVDQLVELHLDFCRSNRLISPLPNLRVLKIEFSSKLCLNGTFPRLEEICLRYVNVSQLNLANTPVRKLSTEGGNIDPSIDLSSLQQLEVLVLKDTDISSLSSMKHLAALYLRRSEIRKIQGDFPVLKVMKLIHCKRIKLLPLTLPAVTELSIINDPADFIAPLRSLSLAMKKLRKLELVALRHLTHLPSGMNSLRYLSVEWANFKEIPKYLGLTLKTMDLLLCCNLDVLPPQKSCHRLIYEPPRNQKILKLDPNHL